MSFAPYLSLAKLYDEDERFAEAVKAYQESLKRFPRHTRALRLLAETYQKMGEAQKALDTYRRLADLDDEPINRYRAVDIDVDANFAYAYYALGRAELRPNPEAALSWFQRVVGVVDEYFKPGGGYSLDQMFARVGKPRTNRAEELLPLKAKALWRMADIYDSMAKPAEATAKREEAVRASAQVARLVADEDKGGQP
jgi:tetratricopeptide (TPR) repeat protein